jgi:universal stress protein E
MSSIKKILVDLDPTREQQPALHRAIYLAKEFDATLTLFLVTYNRGLVSNLFFDSEQLEAAKKGYVNSQKKWVDSFLNEAVNQGVKVDVDVVWAKPIYEAINAKAESGNYDLVIKSTHSHPTINKIFFTPNDWQLLKTCKKPLILAKENGVSSYQNIMAAIDPSNRHEHSEQLDPLILTTARSFSNALNAKPHAVHCYDPIAFQMWTDIGVGMGVGMGPADFSMGQENYDQYIEQLKKDNQQTFNEAIAEVDFPSDNLHLEEGYPEQILPSVVKKQKIDLIVMGTSYHSGLIGSTVEKILDDVDCDVLAVKV